MLYTSNADKDLSLRAHCNPSAGVKEYYVHAVNLAFMSPLNPHIPPTLGTVLGPCVLSKVRRLVFWEQIS